MGNVNPDIVEGRTVGCLEGCPEGCLEGCPEGCPVGTLDDTTVNPSANNETTTDQLGLRRVV
jgi:hypothetical protein